VSDLAVRLSHFHFQSVSLSQFSRVLSHLDEGSGRVIKSEIECECESEFCVQMSIGVSGDCGSECVWIGVRERSTSRVREFCHASDLRSARRSSVQASVHFGERSCHLRRRSISSLIFFFFWEFCGRSGAGAGATVLVSLRRE
jgi:hypothetical protein